MYVEGGDFFCWCIFYNKLMYIFYITQANRGKVSLLLKLLVYQNLCWVGLRLDQHYVVGRRWVLLLSDRCIVWNGTKLCHTDFTFTTFLGGGRVINKKILLNST